MNFRDDPLGFFRDRCRSCDRYAACRRTNGQAATRECKRDSMIALAVLFGFYVMLCLSAAGVLFCALTVARVIWE